MPASLLWGPRDSRGLCGHSSPSPLLGGGEAWAREKKSGRHRPGAGPSPPLGTRSPARATAPSPGRPTPGVVKQHKSSGGSVDTTKTRSGPQRVRMSSGERPMGAAKQTNTMASCQNPPPHQLFHQLYWPYRPLLSRIAPCLLPLREHAHGRRVPHVVTPIEPIVLNAVAFCGLSWPCGRGPCVSDPEPHAPSGMPHWPLQERRMTRSRTPRRGRTREGRRARGTTTTSPRRPRRPSVRSCGRWWRS